MNWVDLVIVLVLLCFAYLGFGRSFLKEVLGFLTFLLSFVLSLRFYDFVSQIYEQRLGLVHSLSTVLAFISIWLVVEFILALVIDRLVKLSAFEFIDKKLRIFSVIPAIFRGLIFVTILLVAAATFPIQPALKSAVQSSKLGSLLIASTYGVEAPLKNVFGGITQDTLTFLTVEPEAKQSINLGFKTSNFKSRPDLENQMLGLVNKERTSRGLKSLEFDPKLLLVAREHSSDMFERGYFSHYSPDGKTVVDRAAQYNVDYQVIGENLAYAPTLILAHNGLMNSPGHRANILSVDFNKVGIGIMDGGVFGLMITQDFTN